MSVFDGRHVTRTTFTQLREDVERARDRLLRAGLEPGAWVGLLGENCYAWIVYDLAVLSLGCILVAIPVDELGHVPPAELAERYELSLLLATKAARITGTHPWVSIIDDDDAAPVVRRRVDPASPGSWRIRAGQTDACTVIHSSGTSGQLKALLLSRAGVEDTIDVLAGHWGLGPEDRVLVALPLSIFQQRLLTYAALRTDAEVVLTDSRNLFRGLRPLQPTFVLAPPAVFETIENRVHALPPEQRAEKTREVLGGRARLLLTGSAPSKPSTLELFESVGLPLWQAYGMAEVGFIAWNRPGAERPLSVGRPIVPGSVSIEDDGEIVVGVPHRQALGYLGLDPAEEARTFLPDGRVVTGDLGRFDDDGYLFITGRKKSVILLQSGEKLSPESLEKELPAPAGVEHLVVTGGGELPWPAAVVAIGPDVGEADEARIRAEVQQAIDALNARVKPSSRIARLIVTRERFRPETGLLTRNLKLDRRAIHARFESELLDAPAHVTGAPS